MSTTLVDLINTKLNLSVEPKVKSKISELLRLLELRLPNVPTQINEYGKIVICADIAANLLSVDFNKENAIKLSGLRKSHYENFKRLFEKILDLNRTVGTKDICVKLSISGVNTKADELLALYEKIVAAENPDIDINHPQYAAMAVFQACKLMKQKVIKPKILPFSNLRPTQWASLEQRWDKFLAEHYSKAIENKLKNSSEELVNGNNKTEIKQLTEKRRKVTNIVEDYEHWKCRILKAAETKLNSLNTTERAEIDKQII